MILEVILTVAIKELSQRFHKANYLQEEHALPQGEFSPLQMSFRVSYFWQNQACLKRARNTIAKVKTRCWATHLCGIIRSRFRESIKFLNHLIPSILPQIFKFYLFRYSIFSWVLHRRGIWKGLLLLFFFLLNRFPPENLISSYLVTLWSPFF